MDLEIVWQNLHKENVLQILHHITHSIRHPLSQKYFELVFHSPTLLIIYLYDQSCGYGRIRHFYLDLSGHLTPFK